MCVSERVRNRQHLNETRSAALEGDLNPLRHDAPHPAEKFTLNQQLRNSVAGRQINHPRIRSLLAT
jgi:hypothetical protein